jgi:hypothetical protein
MGRKSGQRAAESPPARTPPSRAAGPRKTIGVAETNGPIPMPPPRMSGLVMSRPPAEPRKRADCLPGTYSSPHGTRSVFTEAPYMRRNLRLAISGTGVAGPKVSASQFDDFAGILPEKSKAENQTVISEFESSQPSHAFCESGDCRRVRKTARISGGLRCRNQSRRLETGAKAAFRPLSGPQSPMAVFKSADFLHPLER